MNRLYMAFLVMAASTGVAFAADAAVAQFFGSTAIAAGIGVGIAAGGGGLGMGLVIASALQGMARQPELTSKLQMQMLLGFALIEAQVLYMLFIAIILLFANPFKGYVIGG
jgi:F-type H+-transporting ATPase subunit c